MSNRSRMVLLSPVVVLVLGNAAARINVKALSGLPGFVGTVFTGAIWSTVYWKTRSLRWPIFSHFVVDLLSVSVLVFLNRAVLAM